LKLLTPEAKSVKTPGNLKYLKLSAGTVKVAQGNNPNNAVMELGKLYYERCDFGIALDKFKLAADGYFAEKNFEQYLKCQNYLLRIYAEREENEEIRVTKERLQDLVLKEGFELTAKTYYTLGICAIYKEQAEIALDYFQKSLSVALSTDSKEDICYAIFALSITYYQLDRLTEALKEIYNLQIFFQVMDIPELKLASEIHNGNILRKLKKFEQALEIFWGCYDLLQKDRNLFMYINLLRCLGMTYRDAGENDMARLYLKLARKSIDPENMLAMARSLDGLLAELGEIGSEDFDLVFDGTSNSVSEKKKGRIDFKNQFILLDMLRLFMKQPGVVHSKEHLVKQVWKQDYDPIVHDNKIYVTIKRLRKLIEPDYDKPKYIFRAKNGYYLNKSAKILVQPI
jgi:DNA-binding winged helix-turn-helix (wHTH) protein